MAPGTPYTNLVNHPVTLEDGRVVGYGETVELTEKEAADGVNADLIEMQMLRPQAEAEPSTKPATAPAQKKTPPKEEG